MALPLAVVRLEDEEQEESLDEKGYFSTIVRRGGAALALYQVAILVSYTDDVFVILEVGTAKRSYNPIVTGRYRVQYQRRTECEPLPVDDLVDLLPSRRRAGARSRFRNGGAFTDLGRDSIVSLFDELRPAAGETLRELLAQRQPRRPQLSETALQAAAQEADAVVTAMQIAGIPRSQLDGVGPDGEIPFLDRLAAVRVPEDAAINFDAARFVDFDAVEASPGGFVTFERRGQRLVVFNVNRQSLEHTTGADLIYFNESSDSFVFVQYKSYRVEGGARRTLAYRPDGQLAEELTRMHTIRTTGRGVTPEAYRVGPGCCFLKFCPPVATLGAPADELINGDYLPIDYYELLAASQVMEGVQGGRVLYRHALPRSMNQRTFTTLVADGWVGSHGTGTATLTALVEGSVGAGRSATVAVASEAQAA